MAKADSAVMYTWPDYIKLGQISYPPGGTLGPRIQSTYELVMIHSGEMTVYIDNQPYYSMENTITIMFPGYKEHYIFSTVTNTQHSYIHIALPNIPVSLKKELYRLPKTIPLSPRVQELTQEALKLKSSTIPTRDMMLKTISSLILWQFIGEAKLLCVDESVTPPHAIIETACRFIEAHLNDNISLEQIANEVSVCQEHLIRVFKKEMGTTPMSFLWEKRVSLGIDLLEYSGLSVSVIAERCGFKTRNHFSRKVHETTGFSPREVRKKTWRQIK